MSNLILSTAIGKSCLHHNKGKIMKSSKLPIQASPVERTITGTPMSINNGVEPSFLFAIPAAISAGKAIYNALK